MARRTFPLLFRSLAVLLPIAFMLSESATESARPSSLSCYEPTEGVTWVQWTASGQDSLDDWCATVGPPVLFEAPTEPLDVTRLAVVTWNVHVGGAQIEEFVRTHWTDRSRTGLVLLLQETYRESEAVPESLPAGLKVPAAIRPQPRSPGIAQLAARLNLSVAYVPSMRNGRASDAGQREDRGNAILSSEPLTDIRAIVLPFGKQRRVAVAATVTPRGAAIAPMRVVSTHFDIGGARVAQAQALSDRMAGLTDIPVILGGDFNSPSGVHDKAVQAIDRHLEMEPCGTSRTFTWPSKFNLTALLNFGRFDFIFSSLHSSGLTKECRTIDDRFRSDHSPVMLTLHRVS